VAYPFDIKNESNWMSKYFFTGGMMPSHCLPLYFQQDLRIDGHWAVDGRHYERTLRDWLAIMDRRKTEVMSILETTYGKENAVVWFNRWRVFFLACAELFGFNNGQEWWVSHYRFGTMGDKK
jgi:cyclopropane-fatty-acyl-phospholipid synthase